eukprot:scaffold7745_cov103-Cylindrotheca_fusiformis.AAC.1
MIVECHFDEVHDVVERMRIQEGSTYAQSIIEDELVGLWRKMLVDWMYYVIDYCHLQRQAVAAAAFFYDVAVQKKLVKTPEEHQLAAATALQLALKTHDSSVIKLGKLVKLGRGLFTEDDVVKMEREVIKSMNWKLHPPSTYCFLRQYERLLPTTISETTRSMINTVTSLACEVTLTDYRYLSYKPSAIAYASMILALEMIPHDDLPIVQRHCFLLQMSTIAELDSKSKSVREAFKAIKESIQECPKNEKLLATLEKQHKQQERDTRCMLSKPFAVPAFNHSPRHVMARLLMRG